MLSFRPLILLVMITSLATFGCQPAGPPVAKVQGSVTFKGAPLTAGVVIFQAESGPQTAMDDLDAAGKFELKFYDAAGIPPGRYKVAIKPPPQNYQTPPLADAAINDPRPLDTTIPTKYHNSETSGLTADVKLDQPNDFQFHLTP